MRKKHRIIAVTSIFTVILVGGGVAVLVRQQMLNNRALENRELGMTAIANENYGDALHGLGSYLQRYGQEDDAEALFEYARARRNVPLPNNKHVGQAIGHLLQVLSVDPSHRKAQIELLDLYTLAGYGQETLDLAEKVLEAEPENLDALRAQAKARARTRDFSGALEAASKLTTIAPEGTADHLLVIALMQSADIPNAEIIAYPDAQEALDRNQAPYHIVRAAALQMAGQRDEAIASAKRAAELAQLDSEDIPLVNDILTGFGLYDESLNFLARTASASEDPDLLQAYCQRLFEIGNTAEVLRLTGEKGIPSLTPSLLAVRAMAAGREGKKEQLQEVVSELQGKTDDALAKAWASVLDVMWLRDDVLAQDVMKACMSALESDQSSPYFHYFVGLAHDRLGERDSALISLQNAVRLSPAWIDPILRSASLLAARGGHAEAFTLVRAALQRAPQNAGVAAAGAEIIGSDIEGLSEENRAQLLKLCEQVQSAQAMESRTLPILIHLRALQGDKATATELTQAALQSEVQLPESTLLKLAQLSDQHELGLTEACFARINDNTGVTPGLAFAQATSLLRNGDPEAGRVLLSDAAAKAGDDPRWQMAMAQYLDLTGSDEALAMWVAIGEKASGDAALLRMILDSRTAWQDLALIDRTIEHLRSTTGESAVNWRTARARWMLLSDPSQKSAAEAAALLNESMQVAVPDPLRYTLLATALRRLNNMQGAIESLERAAQVAPQSTAVQFELAELRAARGDAEQAMAHVQRALESKQLTDDDLRRAVVMLVQGNQVEKAIQVLEGYHQSKGETVPLDFQLAQLYRRVGQLDKAEAICKRFLAERPDEFVIALAADLYAIQGRKDEALATLSALDSLDLKPGHRLLILAEYHRSHGTVEEAASAYEQAIAEAGSDPIIWRRQLVFLVRGPEPAAAIGRIADAVAACPDEQFFKDLGAQAPLMQKLIENALARPFIVSAIENPGSEKIAAQALESIDKNPEDLIAIAADFRRIAEETPGYLPVQIQLVRIYSALNRHGEAAEIAAQAMRDFPFEIEPAVLAAQAYSAAGNWTAAMSASQEWRRRAPNGPQAADFMIANAQIQLGQSSEALETIQAYADQAPNNPMVVARQAQALIVGGRMEDAENLLRSQLAEPGFRMAWVELATLVIPDEPAAARWLNEVATLIPEESLEERGALALAWYQLAERFKNTTYRDQSRELLEALALRPDVTPDLLFRLGMVYDVSGVHELAEANYKRAIELAPDMIAAKNNLAMRYIMDKRNLEEALKLAQEAAASAPNSANVQDTLAQAQAALGNHAAAIISLQKAAELEPDNREWSDRLELMRSQHGEAPVAATGPSS